MRQMERLADGEKKKNDVQEKLLKRDRIVDVQIRAGEKGRMV